MTKENDSRNVIALTSYFLNSSLISIHLTLINLIHEIVRTEQYSTVRWNFFSHVNKRLTSISHGYYVTHNVDDHIAAPKKRNYLILRYTRNMSYD